MLTTAYDYECSSSTLVITLGTLERCQRPVPVRSSNLLLVLDAPSAGGEDPVVWNVIRTHTRSRNTCNVKSGRLPVHLGLDPATSRRNIINRIAKHAIAESETEGRKK